MNEIETPEPKGKSDKKMIFVILGVLVLLGVGYIGFSQREKPKVEQKQTELVVSESPEEKSITLNNTSILYGVWTGDKSLIKAFNIGDTRSYLVAELPQNVKKITAVMPDSLYYINETDENDHGTEIVKFSLSGKQETSLVTAEAEYGIDDYFISSDGKYLTTWEVKVESGKRELYGGQSRVYSVDLSNPTAKNLLYNEQADKPIHYPRGITSNGTVITDMFLPNSGPGWAYGMNTSNLTGTINQDIPSMAHGTYGRQPKISQDGTQVVFAGYDGAFGSGTEQIRGIRRALLQPNTIELLSVQSMERTKLPNLSNRYIYDDVEFDQTGNNLLINQIKYIKNEYQFSVAVFNIGNSTSTEVPNSKNKRGYGVLSDQHVLLATPNVSNQTIGNLGKTYQFLNTNFEVINLTDGQATSLAIPDTNLQFIGVVSTSKIEFSLFTDITEKSKDALQLHTFALKTNLLPDRIKLQAGSLEDLVQSADPEVRGINILAQDINPPGEADDDNNNENPPADDGDNNNGDIPNLDELVKLIEQLIGMLEELTQN